MRITGLAGLFGLGFTVGIISTIAYEFAMLHRYGLIEVVE